MNDITSGAVGQSSEDITVNELEPTARVPRTRNGGERDTGRTSRRGSRKPRPYPTATEEEIAEFEEVQEGNPDPNSTPTPRHKIDRLA